MTEKAKRQGVDPLTYSLMTYYGGPSADKSKEQAPLTWAYPDKIMKHYGMLFDAVDPQPTVTAEANRGFAVPPGTPFNSKGIPYNPEVTDPAVAARVAQSMAAIKQAQVTGVPWYEDQITVPPREQQ